MRLVSITAGYSCERAFLNTFSENVKCSQNNPIILQQGDVLLFEGGTDIGSHLYGEERNRYTSPPDRLRDLFEVGMFTQAKKLGLPMIGICRGAQLLCALSGGKLVQHVDMHGRDHWVTDYKGDEYKVTSTHHQMMYPKDVKHHIIASTNVAKIYLGENEQPIHMEEDPEIVWFPETKSLAIQGHPEYSSATPEFVAKTLEYTLDFIINPNQ